MDIGKILKKLELNILWQSGIAVTPEQVGLKPGDFPTPFSQCLNTTGGSKANPSASLPEPPSPPEDPSDLDAQKKFNEELLAYNQQMAGYHQRLFGLMMQQFRQLQYQSLRQSSLNRSVSLPPSSSTSSISSDVLSTGDIL